MWAQVEKQGWYLGKQMKNSDHLCLILLAHFSAPYTCGMTWVCLHPLWSSTIEEYMGLIWSEGIAKSVYVSWPSLLLVGFDGLVSAANFSSFAVVVFQVIGFAFCRHVYLLEQEHPIRFAEAFTWLVGSIVDSLKVHFLCTQDCESKKFLQSK